MPVNPEYVEKLRQKNLTIPGSAKDLLSIVFERDLTEAATPDEIRDAQHWIHSDEKRRRDQECGDIFSRFAMPFVNYCAQYVQSYDGTSGFFELELGFLGSLNTYTTTQTKIRTMQPDAHSILPTPFDSTTFQGGLDSFTPDPRILPTWWAKLLRRTGLDELPQLAIDLKAGRVSMVGARGYTLPELEGTKILIAHRYDRDLRLSLEAINVLDTYQEKVDRYQPKPACFSPLAATLAKDSPPIFRMWADIAYWERANPRIDRRIFEYSLIRRLQGIGAR